MTHHTPHSIIYPGMPAVASPIMMESQAAARVKRVIPRDKFKKKIEISPLPSGHKLN
jgi:hypothetical protein